MVKVQAAMLVARVQARYEALYQQRLRFAHPALRWALELNALPGLALYLVLREQHPDREAALAETGALLAAAGWLSKRFPLLRYLPDSFTVFTRVFAWLVRLGLPRPGWDMTVDEQSERSFAFTRSSLPTRTISSPGCGS